MRTKVLKLKNYFVAIFGGIKNYIFCDVLNIFLTDNI